MTQPYPHNFKIWNRRSTHCYPCWQSFCATFMIFILCWSKIQKMH